MTRVPVVSGTGTGVGKTVVTAAIAAPAIARFPDPLSPEAAARVAGLAPLDLRAAADYVAKLAESRDLVLVEGAGGLLVRYDPGGGTIADLAAALDAPSRWSPPRASARSITPRSPSRRWPRGRWHPRAW